MSKNNLNTDFVSPQAAEAAFYAAFADCDLSAMSAVWADSSVVCIHPGSNVLIGRDEVMRSWANILLNSEPPTLHVEVLSRTEQDGIAVHVVEERISPGGLSASLVSVVLATNIYRLGANGWKLFEHHASVPRSKTNANMTTAHRTIQ
ncbi:nuclear transport factor 2 family protein [Kaarinaea lacus]